MNGDSLENWSTPHKRLLNQLWQSKMSSKTKWKYFKFGR